MSSFHRAKQDHFGSEIFTARTTFRGLKIFVNREVPLRRELDRFLGLWIAEAQRRDFVGWVFLFPFSLCFFGDSDEGLGGFRLFVWLLVSGQSR